MGLRFLDAAVNRIEERELESRMLPTGTESITKAAYGGDAVDEFLDSFGDMPDCDEGGFGFGYDE